MNKPKKLRWAGSQQAQREHEEAVRNRPPRPRKVKGKKAKKQKPVRPWVPYDEYLRSDWWRKRRRQAIKKAKFRCQSCGKGGPFEVHHRTYVRLWGERDKDLEVLCPGCHGYRHSATEQMESHLDSICRQVL